MSKLTLSVDERVVSRAKSYAKQHGVSVSAMVEAYLASVIGKSAGTHPDAPILRRVRGTLKTADREAHRKRVASKYR